MGIKTKEQRVPSDIPPLTYGVWITGIGWLKDENSRFFADPRLEYAQTALRMWAIGDNTPCRVELIDNSMIGLQNTFMAREQKHLERIRYKKELRKQQFRNSIIGRILHGLLERFNRNK